MTSLPTGAGHDAELRDVAVDDDPVRLHLAATPGLTPGDAA